MTGQFKIGILIAIIIAPQVFASVCTVMGYVTYDDGSIVEEGTPLVVIAGSEYGTGSSRDWAAKGTLLLGVKAVIAKSFERIHRSNLIGMGVLPLQFLEGQDAEALELTGTETFDIKGQTDPNAKTVKVTATTVGGHTSTFEALVRIDTPKERDYYENGGILHYVLRQLAA